MSPKTNPKTTNDPESKVVEEKITDTIEKDQTSPSKIEETEEVNNPVETTESKSSVSSEEVKMSSESEQVVVFTLANEEYAVPILDVQEIIPTGEITPFPNVSDYIAGIINVRGTVATVINLAKKFKLERKSSDTQTGNESGKASNAGQDKYIILTNINKSMFGMMVDEVTEVTKIATSDIKQATGMMETNVQAEFISRVAVVGERVILILDFDKVVSEEDIVEATA